VTLAPSRAFPYRNVEYYHHGKALRQALESFLEEHQRLSEVKVLTKESEAQGKLRITTSPLILPHDLPLWPLDPPYILYQYYKNTKKEEYTAYLHEQSKNWPLEYPDYWPELELFVLAGGTRAIKPKDLDPQVPRRTFAFFPLLAQKEDPGEALVFVEEFLLARPDWEGINSLLKATTQLGESARLLRHERCWEQDEHLSLAVSHIRDFPTEENLMALARLRKHHKKAQELYQQHLGFYQKLSGGDLQRGPGGPQG
jgi:hypothetical protein